MISKQMFKCFNYWSMEMADACFNPVFADAIR